MAASEFFARWAKGSSTPTTGSVMPAAPAATLPADAVPATRDPGSLNAGDAALLNDASDFKPFMAAGVDEGVRRLALKRLFADPQFNVMDGLDIYVGDYNSFTPMSAAMVAALSHGKELLAPLVEQVHAAWIDAVPGSDTQAPIAAATCAPDQIVNTQAAEAVEVADVSSATNHDFAVANSSGHHDDALPSL
jgi:hypothetical protein